MRFKYMLIADVNYEWLEDNYMNLSKFIRDKIDEEMEDEG